MLSDVGDLARMRYGVRKLAELVQQPAIVGITDMADEAPMLMGRDPSADGSTSNAAFPSRMPPAEVLAMSDDELDAWMVFNCGDGIHTTGSCRMGSPDDPLAVVSPAGEVFGVEALRVADASIMPRITNGNLNAPTIMLAEKLADAVRGRAPLPRPEGPLAEVGAGEGGRQRPGPPARAVAG